MQQLVYTVTASFADSEVAEEWAQWLRSGHVQEVMEVGGATEVEIARLNGESSALEVRYHFPDEQAFDRYERDHAPRLRAEGLKRFPPECGIAYQRSTAITILRIEAARQK